MEEQTPNINPFINRFPGENAVSITDHRHNGYDSSRVMWGDLIERKVFVHHTIVASDAATAANYTVFWIAPFKCYVSGFKEVHQTAGSDGGSVTLQLEKLTGTQAPDAGASILSTALSLKETANTVQTGTLTGTIADRSLAIGDRLCLKDSGTLTAVANVTVTVELTIV